jgi:hypothetical protein
MTNILQTLRTNTPNTKPAAATRQPGELWINQPDNQLGFIDTTQTAVPLLAVRNFVATTAYVSGDFVVQGGHIWSAKAAVPAGVFNASQWTQLASMADVAGAYLPLTGGSLSGTLSCTQGFGINGTTAANRQITGYTSGSARWGVTLGNNVAESGSNGGSDFLISSFSDAGAFISNPFTIQRSNGVCFFSTGPYAPGYLINAAAGAYRAVTGQTSNKSRWALILGDATAETGASAGSNFILQSYDDNGAYVRAPIVIRRNDGVITFGGTTVCTSGVVMSAGDANPSFNLTNSGQSTLGYMRYVNGSNLLQLINNAGTGSIMINSDTSFQSNSATAYKPGGGSWTAPSDARIKDVKGDYKKGLDDILKLNPVVYTYKANDTPTDDVNDGILQEGEAKPKVASAPFPASVHYNVALEQTPFVGLVAQATETIFPDIVSKTESHIDGKKVEDLRHINPSNLIYALINAVKTLTARIEVLEGTATGKSG